LRDRRPGEARRPIQTTSDLTRWKVAVKANIDVAGFVTHAGSPALTREPAASSDALVIRQLRRAGAGQFSQTGMHEFAFGVTGINIAMGTPVNPASPGRIPGGSSSGSAVAVASGAARLGVGTDTGGSIRIPAALCGVVGLKLPFDSDLLDGVYPLSPTLDHIGLLTRDVDDLEHAVTALSLGEDPADEEPEFIVRSDDRAEPAIAAQFAEIRQLLAPRSARGIAEDRLPDVDDVHQVTNVIMFFEALATHRQRFGSKIAAVSPDVRHRLEEAAQIDPEEYEVALRARQSIARQTFSILEPHRVLIEPTVLTGAPKVEAGARTEVASLLVKRTRLANACGLPALSLPIRRNGQAISVQITAMTVAAAIRAARHLEEAIA
jgi:Asp-tRNA(Asn)/Glu-tRNA(Gln) amidotransferase A subunit family amidase